MMIYVSSAYLRIKL